MALGNQEKTSGKVCVLCGVEWGLKVRPTFVNSRAVPNFILRTAVCLLVLLAMTLFWIVVFDTEADGLGASFSRNFAELRAVVFGTPNGNASRL